MQSTLKEEDGNDFFTIKATEIPQRFSVCGGTTLRKKIGTFWKRK